MNPPHIRRRAWPRPTEPQRAGRTSRGFLALAVVAAVLTLTVVAGTVWALIEAATP